MNKGVKMFRDLIYDPGAQPLIKEKFPEAVFADASGPLGLREGRFEVEIPDVTPDAFYPWFINTGYAGTSLNLLLYAKGIAEGNLETVRGWLDEADKMRATEKPCSVSTT